MRGFVFSLEAFFAFLAVLIAVAALPSFHIRQEEAGHFLECSDAAFSFLSSRAFKSEDASSAFADGASSLSGKCIGVEVGGGKWGCFDSSEGKGQAYAFEVPIYKNGRIENALVFCR